MNIDKLKLFCITAECGSIKEAAAKAGDNYDAFRKKLLKLEEEMGESLFYHKAGRMMLTRRGESFVEYAKRIIRYTENQMDIYKQEEDQKTGSITIATTYAVASLWLSDALEKFVKDFPDIILNIRATDKNIDLLRREADVFLKVMSGTHDDNLVEKELTTYHMNLYASEEYIKKHGKPEKVEDLKNHRIIGYGTAVDVPYPEVNWHLNHLPQNFHPQININSGSAILRCIELDLGIGSISQKGAETSRKKLVPILQDKLKGPTIQVGFSYPKDIEITPVLQQLYEYLLKHFQRVG